MDISETKPAFNLKAVVQKTGIKADTLRSWERRYDLPQPGRSSGGHRLYSLYDIEIIKWIMAQIAEGMTIGLAVDLWRSIEEKGEDPLSIKPSPPPQTVPADRGTPLMSLRQQWIERCLDYDEAGANAVLNQAFALFPIQLVCEEVLFPCLVQVGEGWYQNKLPVQKEHFVSNLTLQRIAAIAAAAPNPTRSETIVLTCPPQEEHTTGLHVFSLLLRYKGWHTIYIGANVPATQFEDLVTHVKPSLIVLAAQRLLTASTLLDTVVHLDNIGIPTAYGGRIFNIEPQIRDRIPSHFLGETVTAGLSTVENILNGKQKMSNHSGTSEHTQKMINIFRSRQAMIGTDVWRSLKEDSSTYPYVNETNGRMVADITAALNLGNLDYMDKELEYTRQLMTNYNIPSEWTDNYLNAFHQATNWHLGSECQPIIDWLEKASNNAHA